MKMNTKAFTSAGIYIMRSEHIYLLAVCHPIGVNRNGPHKHNDWLSFELCIGNQPVIIDPGTFCYTGNMEQRRLFRSTAYHNTVVVDGEEQIDIHNSMFGLINPQGDVKVTAWESDQNYDMLEAEHTGYARLKSPVIHCRRFLLDKQKHTVEITDSFSGQGEHLLEWHFHLESGLNCSIENQGVIILINGNPVMKLVSENPGMNPEIKTGWVSKAYNQKEEAEHIYYRWKGNLSNSLLFIQKIDP
jgi:uncharacterized heparinase superfamily protein